MAGVMSERNRAPLITRPIPSLQHHAVGMFFSGTGILVRIEGKMNAAMYRDILDEDLLQSTLDLRLG